MSHRLAQLYTPSQIFNFVDREGYTYPDIKIVDHSKDQLSLKFSDGKTEDDTNIFRDEGDNFSTLKFLYRVSGHLSVGTIGHETLVPAFFSYANKAWLHNTNCASLAEYLRFGKVSSRRGHNFNFLFSSYTPYNGQPLKVGDVLCIKTLRPGFEERLSKLDRNLADDLLERLDQKNVVAGKCLLRQRTKHKDPVEFKSFFNSLAGHLGDYHFVTCVSFNADGQPFFLSQNGRNFGYDGIQHLPKYNLTDSENILSLESLCTAVYLCS